MRNLILAATILTTAGIAPCFARSGHHGHHRIHGHSGHAVSAPADPSAPKKIDAATPETLDSENAKLDQRIKSICRGC
jgi:hypothetical protein